MRNRYIVYPPHAIAVSIKSLRPTCQRSFLLCLPDVQLEKVGFKSSKALLLKKKKVYRDHAGRIRILDFRANLSGTSKHIVQLLSCLSIPHALMTSTS